MGNLSHALKTPLAVLAQDADEIGRRGDPALAARLHAQLDTMRETMARELHRARLSGGGDSSDIALAAASRGPGSSACTMKTAPVPWSRMSARRTSSTCDSMANSCWKMPRMTPSASTT